MPELTFENGRPQDLIRCRSEDCDFAVPERLEHLAFDGGCPICGTQ